MTCENREAIGSGQHRLKVLFATWGFPPGESGGAEHQAERQAQELIERGHAVTVVCPGERDLILRPPLQGLHIDRLRHVRRRPLRRVSYLFALFIYCLRNLQKYDLVHVHLANLQADIIALAAVLKGKPVWVKVACGGVAGEVERLQRAASVTRWFGFRHAARVQALSQEIAHEMLRIGVRADRIVRIPNGIERSAPELIYGDKRAFRRELGLPEDGILFLFLGRLAAYKGLDVLAQAWAHVVVSGRANLLIVGPQAVDRPLSPDAFRGTGAIVHGSTNEPLKYLSASDVFVYPSLADGMSNAVLEAMSIGLPIIASNANSAPDLLDEGRAGILVPPGDVAALAAAMTRLGASPALRRSLGHAALEQAENFNIRKVVDQIEREYLRLLSVSACV